MKQAYLHVIHPDPLLEEYIQSYTFIKIPVDKLKDLEFTVLPNSHTRMVLFLGEPSLQKIHNQTQKTENISLTGFYSSPQTFIPSSTSLKQVIIQFSPWGMQPFLNFPISEITNSRVDLNLVFKYEVEKLLTDIFREPEWQGLKPALDTFFLSLLKKAKRIDNRIKPTTKMIFDTHGSLRLSHLSQKLFISERTIQRLVHNHLGVPYKFYAMLVRMEYARHLLNDNNLSLTDVALKAGYFDQAHFNHEFLSTYGESPKIYQQRLQKLFWNHLEKNKGQKHSISDL